MPVLSKTKKPIRRNFEPKGGETVLHDGEVATVMYPVKRPFPGYRIRTRRGFEKVVPTRELSPYEAVMPKYSGVNTNW